VLFAFQAEARADYKLQPGDVLEVALLGAPEFRQRLPVEIDGTVMLPMAGATRVAGMTLSDALAAVTRALANKVYQVNQPMGLRDGQRLIVSSEILLTVAEYRPVYVSGYVARPGGYPFRPGLTVRQAIALAGGYGVAQPAARIDAPAQLADLRAEQEALSVEYAMEREHVLQLRKELQLSVASGGHGDAVPLPAELETRIKNNAAEFTFVRMADREKDKAMLKSAVGGADLQLKVLNEKKKQDEEGVQADNDDLESVRQLFRKGITANARLSEARRASLLSSDQLLQTIVQISNLERQRGEYLRQIEKIDSQAKIDGWRDLQQANLRLAQLASRLRSTKQRLIAMGQQTVTATDDRQLRLTVVRYTEGKASYIDGRDDLELTPGDVVDVELINSFDSRSSEARESSAD
jgi:polysaccharide export outer membrane protein